jgi:hypothetical protein
MSRRLCSILFRESRRHVQEDHRLAKLPVLSGRSIHLQRRGGSSSPVRPSLPREPYLSWSCRMMTWADQRLTVNQIKTHPFFFGADWNALRHIDPPFVPHLQSSTDCSYFHNLRHEHELISDQVPISRRMISVAFRSRWNRSKASLQRWTLHLSGGCGRVSARRFLILSLSGSHSGGAHKRLDNLLIYMALSSQWNYYAMKVRIRPAGR